MSHKTLYLAIFAVVLTGCGSLPSQTGRAPVIERLERPSAPAPSPSATAPDRIVSKQTEHSEALLMAISALDAEYRYGGASYSEGFDCSGLVAHVYRSAWGIELPHNARAQSEYGTPVDAEGIAPGDLVFYNTLNRPFSHVGIYLGEGKFIHAPKAGARVRIESLRTAYWTQRFDGARRLLPSLSQY